MRGCPNSGSAPPEAAFGGPILILPVGTRGTDGLEWNFHRFLAGLLGAFWCLGSPFLCACTPPF